LTASWPVIASQTKNAFVGLADAVDLLQPRPSASRRRASGPAVSEDDRVTKGNAGMGKELRHTSTGVGPLPSLVAAPSL